MKVEIKRKDHEDKFPCLMESIGGDVIYFIAPKRGFILKSHTHPYGEYSERWDMEGLSLFRGTIELSNE